MKNKMRVSREVENGNDRPDEEMVVWEYRDEDEKRFCVLVGFVDVDECAKCVFVQFEESYMYDDDPENPSVSLYPWEYLKNKLNDTKRQQVCNFISAWEQWAKKHGYDFEVI